MSEESKTETKKPASPLKNKRIAWVSFIPQKTKKRHKYFPSMGISLRKRG
jgi:hypothetical protein